MAYEPERKYMVNNEQFEELLTRLRNGLVDESEFKLVFEKEIQQAYLTNECTVTVPLDKPEVKMLFSNGENYITTIKEADHIQLMNCKSFKVEALNDHGVVDPDFWNLRVRIYDQEKAEICLKERIAGGVRGEVEAEFPILSAKAVFQMSILRIWKKRFNIKSQGYNWEIDKFKDRNSGLIIAELETEDSHYPKPYFLGTELTSDKRFYNESLAENPFINFK